MVLKPISLNNNNNINNKKNYHTQNNIIKRVKAVLPEKRAIESKKIYDLYKSDFVKEFEAKNYSTKYFLKNHDIEESKYARLINWIIEITKSYDCTEKCFYQTFTLFQKYLINTKNKYANKDLELLGVTCLYVAAKMEEILPFKSSTIAQKICFNKIHKNAILALEFDILKTFDYKYYN